jgi:hypothetical protein
MLLSQSEYAKLRGVSKNAVSKAIKANRIFLVDGKLDPDLANRDWEANSNHRQQRKAKAPESIAPAAAGSLEVAGTPKLVGPPELDEGTFHDAQRQLEWEKVRKQRQARKLREGELVLAADVVKEWERHIDAVKNRLLLLESKVPAECRALVGREIRSALEELAGDVDAAAVA